ncbi:biorientation of chromosomes in cell division protein 1 [Pteropus vampyrus]|uniref:Biorientation of chromosomes in cell division protein 1 n=1 Tax=Pteropus vampyrus TaxID=132908 RepID=A0A6P3RKS5_PTEVA|nr:biorientation of chromosomes in cell division protein 1 [Pteropus vampyrus]
MTSHTALGFCFQVSRTLSDAFPFTALEVRSYYVPHLTEKGSGPSFFAEGFPGPSFVAENTLQPAYQNLRQKVDNFVSTHLDKQEWNPTMNKNQVRNGLRQSVVQSGMLEAGVDRIISQVVDPKLNHIFRPQIERAIHEFLAAKKKEVILASPPELESQDPAAPSQDAP